jgi:hypothetical protein
VQLPFEKAARLRSRKATQMSDWIEWMGGECPVANDVQVIVRLRNDGAKERSYPWPADALWWDHRKRGSDIIAYRIVDPATPAPEKGNADD